MPSTSNFAWRGLGLVAGLALCAASWGNESSTKVTTAKGTTTKEVPPLPKAAATLVTPMSIEATADAWVFPLRIQAAGDQNAKELSWTVHPLWGPGGKVAGRVACSGAAASGAANGCDGHSFPLDKGTILEVELRAEGLLRSGSYNALVELTSGKQRETKTLEIKRVLREAPIKDYGSEPRGNRELSFTLVADAEAGPQKLGKIQVLTLVRAGGDKTPLSGTSYSGLKVLKVDEMERPAVLMLKTADPKRFVVGFEELDPGQYTGKLGIAVEGAAKILSVDFKVYSHWPWWVAGLIVAAGAIISDWIRNWGSTLRPALLRRRQIAVLRSALAQACAGAGVLDALEQSVVDALSSQIDELERSLAFEVPDDFDTTRRALVAKVELLPDWVAAKRRLQTLEPVSLRTPALLAVLNDGRRWFVDPASQPGDPSIAAVKQLDADITQAVQTKLTQDIANLQASVAAQHADDRLPSAQRARLQGRVEPLLADAAKLASQPLMLQAARDQAVNKLNDARREYALVMIEDLREFLNAPSPVDLDDEGAAWAALHDKVLAVLDDATTPSADVAQRYADAWRVFANGYCRLLLAEADVLAKLAADTPDLAARVAAERSAIEQLAAMSAGATAVDLRLHQDALQRLAKLTGGQAGDRQGGEVADVVTTGGIVRSASLLARLVDAARSTQAVTVAAVPDDADALAKRIKRGDFTITLVSGALAIFLGLQTLYIGNPGWGGMADALIALLWGFGFHMGASGSFEGISGVRRKLVG